MPLTAPPLDDMIKRGCELYRHFFNSDPTFAGVAPGRVNVIGGHTDYNDGFVLPMALPNVVLMVGSRNNSDEIRLGTEEGIISDGSSNFTTFNIPSKTKLQPGLPKWANYAKGVIALFPHEITGFNAVIVSSVPVGAGLSSSAAVEVATCSFLEAITATKLDPQEKAKLCQKAEQTFPGVPCGIMDQLISVKGLENKALAIDCRSLEMEFVDINDDSLVFLIINSKLRHELAATSEYTKRKADCERVAKILGVRALRDATMKQVDTLLKQEMISETVYRRARHVIKENIRVYEAAHAIKKRDYDTLGLLMLQSHYSLRLDYEVSCDELDQLVDIVSNTKGALGSRMVGAGFGGCTVNLVKKDQVNNVIKAVQDKYKATVPDFYIAVPSDGAKIINLNKYLQTQI